MTQSRCMFVNGQADFLIEDDEETRLKFSCLEPNRCSGALRKLFGLREENPIRFNGYGAKDRADLILSRAVGMFSTDQQDVLLVYDPSICEFHIDKLLVNWSIFSYKHFNRESSGQRRPICSFPTIRGFDNLHTNKTTIIGIDLPALTKQQAEFIFKNYHILLHIGLPTCFKHNKKINAEMKRIENIAQIAVANNNENLEKDEDMPTDHESINNEVMSSENEKSINSEESQSQEEMDYIPNPNDLSDEEVERLISEDTLQAVKDLAESLSLNKLFERKKFHKLTRKTQLLKARHVRKMRDAINKAVCPSNPSALNDVVESTIISPTTNSDLFINELMTKIKNDYSNATNLHIRNAILSVISSTIPFTIFTKYIKNVSFSTYRRSQYTPTIEAQMEKDGAIRHKMKYPTESVNNFVQFIASPALSTDLPFGSQILTMSDGQKIDVPQLVRRHRKSEIIALYKSFLVESGQTELAMSTSSYVRILDALPAKSSKALQCMDYFISDGETAYNVLFECIEYLFANDKLFDNEDKMFVQALKESKMFLLGDYRIHIKMESPIIEYSIVHGLNCKSKTSKEFFNQIETPTIRSDPFYQYALIIDQIRERFIQLANDIDDSESDRLQMERYKFECAVSKIDEMSRHLLRTGHSMFTKTGFLDLIRLAIDGLKGLLTMDYAQKFLPQIFLESQREYYAKRGLSYHVSHLQIKRNGVFYYKYFVHIIEGTDQGSASIIAILNHICNLVKNDVKQLIIRSDNAACYKSAELLHSIPKISHSTGVDIEQYNFSEPQFGKGPSDRGASIVKRRANAWLNSGHDIKDELGLFNAIVGNEETTPKSMSIFMGKISTKEGTTKAPAIESIKQLHDFKFFKTLMMVRKYADIGSGRAIKYNNDLSPLPSFTVFQQFEARQSFSEVIPRRTAAENPISSNDENNDESNEVDVMWNGLYCCSICPRRFKTESRFLKHMELGNHFIQPESDTIQDAAIKAYQAAIQSYNHISSTLAHQLLQSTNVDDNRTNIPTKQEGWALPSKRKNVRFNPNQHAFLTNIFNEGAKDSKRKKTPQAVEKLMPNARENGRLIFKPEECLNRQQIQSYFGRLKKKADESKSIETKKAMPDEDEPVSDDEKSEVGNEDDISDDEVPQEDLDFDVIRQNIPDIIEKNC